MQRLRRTWLLALVGTLLFTGVISSSAVSADSCQLISHLGDQSIGCSPGAPPVPTASSPAVFHTVLPKETDPAIDDPTGGPHLASAAPCTDPQHNYLVLFLAGTGFDATQGRPLLDLATQHCLHAIGLGYPNAEAVIKVCTNDPDPDCYEQWRLQKLDGMQRSPHLNKTRRTGSRIDS